MRQLPDRMTIEEVYATWINGNISDAKLHVKRMKKSKLIAFTRYVASMEGTEIAFIKVQKLLD